jgi:DNA-binding NarL/FixJ family response regulator
MQQIPIRVLVVDDHKIVREGLVSLLSEQSDINVIGQAGNGKEAVEFACSLHPNVVIMDISMPLMSGDEASRLIKQNHPHIRIIALSMFEDREIIQKMLNAGAESYVLKTAPSQHLLAAIRGH